VPRKWHVDDETTASQGVCDKQNARVWLATRDHFSTQTVQASVIGQPALCVAYHAGIAGLLHL